MKQITLKSPYLVFVGDEPNYDDLKTGAGLVQWRRELCAGQLKLPGGGDLGIPDLTVEEARAAGVRSLVVGTALVGGGIPEHWLKVLVEAAAGGMDIVAGLHTSLARYPALAAAVEQGGGKLVDVRVPPEGIGVGTGLKRSGKRLLTVGTDCALGKKYAALQLEQDMRAAGMNVRFRASGQTGIMIAGEGIPLDAVVSDFLTGAAELLSPANDEDHWDVIEGQGAICHPAYAPVSIGLLMGSQPDAFVVCHAPRREVHSSFEHVPLPTIAEVIERTVLLGRQSNPDIRCVGISVNTSKLPESEREGYKAELAARYGLPCVDPLVDGTAEIVREIQA